MIQKHETLDSFYMPPCPILLIVALSSAIEREMP